MEENGRALACVLGEIDLVRALGLGGISCAVAAVPGDPALYSRHTVAQVPWFHPLDRTEAMLASLMGWGAQQARRPVLYFNGDHDLLLVSRHRDELQRFFDFVVADAELVEDLVDKERFSELARRLELPVPSNVCVDPASSGADEIRIGFPLIIKPLMHRHDIWNPMFGGGKAVRVGSRKEIDEIWPKLERQGPVIAQALVPGPESNVVSYHVYVDREGRAVCEFTGRKIRTSPAEYGDTTALEITEESDVTQLGRTLVERLNLTGVAKFDFKRDAGGRLWLLEVNPRFNLWHHAGAIAGANIPVAVHRNFAGGTVGRCSGRAGTTWCHPTRDAREAKRAGIGLTRWAGWALRCDARWGMSLRDPMPFVRGVVVRRIRAKLGRT